ncbi:glycosyltransferase, partial [bacterium]|nr:glycosyltransferase [bacterium]
AHGWTSTKGLTKNRIYEWLDTLSFKFIDAVVLVNKGMLNSPKLKNRKGINIHIVNNGIPIPDNTVTQFNDSTNQPFDKEIEDFCSKAFTIGSIGRLSSEKGYGYLIEALSLLIKKEIDARLIIIGEGYERDYLECLITKFKLTERVMLPGYRAEAKEFIPYFNVFALSSLTEGLPITLLEAMQARVPVVATNVGGIPDVLQNGDAGLLVEPCNPEALVEEIIKIHNNGTFAQKLVEAAYQRVITNYSSKAMAQKYLYLYNRFAA